MKGERASEQGVSSFKRQREDDEEGCMTMHTEKRVEGEGGGREVGRLERRRGGAKGRAHRGQRSMAEFAFVF